jgi:sigma-B regulation protein RsbU (phosphoserine phosphatase)
LARLRIEEASGQSRTVDLEARRVTIGRAEGNDFAFPADDTLSRRHLAVEPDGAGWAVEDLGSRNGTFLDGQRLVGRAPLQVGGTVQAGGLRLRIESGEPDFSHTVVFVPEGAADRSRSIRQTLVQVVDAAGLGAARTRILIDAGRELAGHRPLAELFPQILRMAMEASQASRGILLTLEDGNLTPRASMGGRFEISRTVRDLVIEKRESLLIEDASMDQALREAKSIVFQQVRSLMAVPLQTKDRVIGLIYVDSPQIIRPFTPEDLSLLTVLANVAAVRIEHARLLEVEQAERLFARDLEQAAEIQRSLLPREAPKCEGLALDAQTVPCRTVGGDFYDYLRLNDGRLAVLVGDVAGKGLPAALMMSGIQARLQVLAEFSSDPGELATRLNRLVAATGPGNRFVTLFLLVIDPVTGQFTYANAGHNPPYLLRATDDMETLSDGGPVLGILRGITYQSVAGQMNAGDRLALFSDGITEARSAAEEELGEERLIAWLRAHPAAGAADLLREVERFEAGAPAADDKTVLMLRKG